MKNNFKYKFIHGAGGTDTKWRKVKPYFENKKTTYVNLSGREGNENKTFQTIQDHAESIVPSITEETILIGHSMGSLIALEVAKRTNLIKGVVMIASSYELPVHQSILDSFAEKKFPEFLFKASYTEKASKELIEEEAIEKNKVSSETIYQDFLACNEYVVGSDTLSHLNIPVMALFGSEDKLLSKDSENKLKEVRPDIQINKIKGEKHYLILESPQQVSEIIKSFASSI